MRKVEGFTLIELLVVIGVIGVLAGGLLTLINPLAQIQKANDARRKSDLNQMQKAIEQYYNDNGQYPSSSISYNIERADGIEIDPPNGESTWVPYMSIVPHDSNSAKRYVYFSNGQSYKLYASLDRGGLDPDACVPDQNKDGTPCTGLDDETIPDDACSSGGSGVANCSYGVSSPNVSP